MIPDAGTPGDINCAVSRPGIPKGFGIPGSLEFGRPCGRSRCPSTNIESLKITTRRDGTVTVEVRGTEEEVELKVSLNGKEVTQAKGAGSITFEYMGRDVESLRILKELKAKGVAGAVYTQTTGVEGEINGLITCDRKETKIPAAELKKRHEGLID